MKVSIATMIATLISAFAMNAAADDIVTVACYPADSSAQLYLQFYSGSNIGLTYSYEGANGTDSCTVGPDSEFSAEHSYVTINGNKATSIELVAQIITGTMDFPVFECNAEVKLSVNSDDEMILVSGAVHHLDKKNDLAEFIGRPCYVQ